MTRLNADDLPAGVRERLGLPGKRSKPKPSRKGTGLSEPSPGACSCGERFPTAAKWEAHSKAEGVGHTRFDLDLGAFS